MEIKTNTYLLKDFNQDEPPQQVSFYEMYPNGTIENGTTIEEMLRVSIARLTDLNSRFSCRENSIAITKMQEALMWLNERTREQAKKEERDKILETLWNTPSSMIPEALQRISKQ